MILNRTIPGIVLSEIELSGDPLYLELVISISKMSFILQNRVQGLRSRVHCFCDKNYSEDNLQFRKNVCINVCVKSNLKKYYFLMLSILENGFDLTKVHKFECFFKNALLKYILHTFLMNNLNFWLKLSILDFSDF